MAVKLGIAGVPVAFTDLYVLCERLGVQPIIILGPDEVLPESLSHVSSVSMADDSAESLFVAVRGEGLAGIWSGAWRHGEATAAVAQRLGMPHLCGLSESMQGTLPIDSAKVFEARTLERFGESERGTLPVPAWVRAARSNGDTSCMRLDSVDELSLAVAKLQKRCMGGTIRVQPVVEGAVYRLLAFKTGRDLDPIDLIAEETTSSAYRVPLALSMPVPRRRALLEHAVSRARGVPLPQGWGYVEFEFVDGEGGLQLVDVQCPAQIDPIVRSLVYLSQGIDLLTASLECALGRLPQLTPSREIGVATTWLLTRSGWVTGFKGVDEARGMPGIHEVNIVAVEGDNLGHVVDLASRGRGGYVIAIGATGAIAGARLSAAREQIWINTTPALP